MYQHNVMLVRVPFYRYNTGEGIWFISLLYTASFTWLERFMTLQLKGQLYEINGKKWMKVAAIQQAGTAGFKDVTGHNKWMGYSGGAMNGGQWLHEVKN